MIVRMTRKGNHSFHYQQRMKEKEKGNTKKSERTQ